MLIILVSHVVMEVSDKLLLVNRDWDPSYLSSIVGQDFFEFSELWNVNNCVKDCDLVEYARNMDHYCPEVEDISLDGEILCNAVEKIEEEWVNYNNFMYCMIG